MTPKRKKSLIQKIARTQAKACASLCDRIADYAEPGFQEFESARALTDYLTANGFKCTYPWKHNPTAFKATWGKTGRSIGLLAEYDALPNCGLKAGTFGHGCCHNLLGTGAAVGGVIAARALEATRTRGKIVVWGCPAEELLAGKVYMARDGAFKQNDAILAWHPGSNRVSRKGGSALDSLLFEFRGKTAHGASAHAGRSALDGVMLLDVSANYLREHVPENVRIHMCVLAGGDAPNVVPAYAKCWYFVRGHSRKQVDEVRKRLLSCAKGAALATGTRMNMKLGKIKGIQINLHYTFLILLAWIGLSDYAASRDFSLAMTGVLFTASIFAMVVLHELGHALTARRFGVGTRDITLLPIGGIARLERMPETPFQELMVSLAGPAVNLGLAGILGIATFLGLGNTFVARLMWTNVGLAVFNLLPAFPMDGGRVLRAFLASRKGREEATRIAARVGRYMAVGFGVLGFFANPILILIAVFVWMAGKKEYETVRLAGSYHNGTVFGDDGLKTYRGDWPNWEEVRGWRNGFYSSRKF